MNVSVTVFTGDAEKMLRQAEEALGPAAVDRVIAETAKALEGEMKERAPVDTGALRNSIQSGADEVTVGAEYGAFVNYGTESQDAQPFVEPAIDAVLPRAMEVLRRRIEGASDGD